MFLYARNFILTRGSSGQYVCTLCVTLLECHVTQMSSNVCCTEQKIHRLNVTNSQVSYNAAGVLAHIASDGADAWTINNPARSEVLVRMVKSIERWNLNAERNINYRSFEPILGLIRCYDTPECQHWAVWALANLTKVSIILAAREKVHKYVNQRFCIPFTAQVYPMKYTRLVADEHGLNLLEELIEHPLPYNRIKVLSKMVLDQCTIQDMLLDG